MSLIHEVPSPSGRTLIFDPKKHKEDQNRWIGLKDYSFFLSDGILQSQGLLLSPFGSKSETSLSNASSLSDFEIQNLKSICEPTQLEQRLHQLSEQSLMKIRQFHKYHYQLFETMWSWKYERALKAKERAELGSNSHAQNANIKHETLASNLSLLLIVPLLKSQAVTDRQLALDTSNVLLDMLTGLPGGSLNTVFDAPLNQLECLFEQWITMDSDNSFQTIGPSVMIGLCCARGSALSILKTIRLLSTQNSEIELPAVERVLKSLDSLPNRLGQICQIKGSKHVTTWQYDDHLDHILRLPTVEEAAATVAETLMRPSQASSPPSPPSEISPGWHGLTTDGTFLYVTAAKGKGLAKIGTGLHGSLQGYVYSFNRKTALDFLAYADGILFGRPTYGILEDWRATVPAGLSAIGVIIDTTTLSAKNEVVFINAAYTNPNLQLMGLTSDGLNFYILQVQLPHEITSDRDIFNVYLDIVQLEKMPNLPHYVARFVRPRILLQNPDLVATSDLDGRDRMEAGQYAHTHNVILSAESVIVESMTSIGIPLRLLAGGSCFTSGRYLTILSEASNNSNMNQTSTGHPSIHIQNLNRHYINGHTLSLQNPKLSCNQIHIFLGEDVIFSKNTIENLPVECSLGKGLLPIAHVGATYDAWNNCIWTASGDHVDSWTNPGIIPPWREYREFTTSCHDDVICDIEFSANTLWSHLAILAHHFINGSLDDANVGFYDLTLSQAWNILSGIQLENLEGHQLTALLLVLQASLKEFKAITTNEAEETLEAVKTEIMNLFKESWFLSKFPCNTSYGVYHEASRLLARIYDHLEDSLLGRPKFLTEMFQLVETVSIEIGSILKNCFLESLTAKFEADDLLYENGHHWILPPWLIKKLTTDDVVKHSLEQFHNYETTGPVHVPVKPIYTILPILPILRILPDSCSDCIKWLISPATSYVSAVVSCLLKSWILVPTLNTPQDPKFATLALHIFKIVLDHCSTIVDGAVEFVTIHSAQKMQIFIGTENILKSSMVGLILPPLALWLAEHLSLLHCDQKHTPLTVCPALENLAEECVQLYVALSHLNQKMVGENGQEDVDDWWMNAERSFGIQNQRTFESQHPVRDGVKTKESVVFANASRLYIKFDPKSATQYDYDKITIYSGQPPSFGRVAEFGGNSYGYGNKTGFWSRNLVRIDGDTLTWTFDVQSGREHNTPDKVVWGYRFTVYPVYETYLCPKVKIDMSSRTQVTSMDIILSEKFFVDKLCLLITDVMNCLLTKLIDGDQPTSTELKLNALLECEIISKLEWNRWNPTIPDKNYLGLISEDDITALRHLADIGPLPQMKPRFLQNIQPFEKLYVIGFLNIIDGFDVNAPMSNDTRLSFRDPPILHELFQLLDSYVRKLISIGEAQLRIIADIEDVLSELKTLDDILQPYLNDSDILQNIRLVFELEVSDNVNIINDLRSIFEIFISDKSCPELTKFEELVHESTLKIYNILQAQKTDLDSYWNFTELPDRFRNILHQYHYFVSCHVGNQNITMCRVLEVMEKQAVRAASRSQGGQLTLKLLECSQHNSTAMVMTSILLKKCKCDRDIIWSNMGGEIQKIAERGILTIIDNIKPRPILYRHTIAILTIIPYKKADEDFLVKSGLWELLDQLSALQPLPVDYTNRGGPNSRRMDPAQARSAASLAWSAFQILAHCCASWESENLTPHAENGKFSFLIASTLTTFLGRATTQRHSVESSEKSDPYLLTPDEIHDVLTLLKTLRKTNLGSEILKQSSCIAQLLALLLDNRQPPIVIRNLISLLSTALPIVQVLKTTDFQQFKFPNLPKSKSNPEQNRLIIVNVLLSKLSEYLVVFGNSRPTKTDTAAETKRANFQSQRTKLRSPVLTISQHGNSGSGGSRAKFQIVDQACYRKNRNLQNNDPSRRYLSGDVASELAREITTLIRLLFGSNEKNSESEHKAEGALGQTAALPSWPTAAETAILSALKPLGKLVGVNNPLAISLDTFMVPVGMAIAALGVLGSLDETIKVGSSAWIIDGEKRTLENEKLSENSANFDFCATKVTINNLCDYERRASVTYSSQENDSGHTREDSEGPLIPIPVSRLSKTKEANSVINELKLSQSFLAGIAKSLRALFIGNKNNDGNCAFQKTLPSLNQILAVSNLDKPTTSGNIETEPESKFTAERMTVVRLLAEVRTRSIHVLSVWLKKREFLDAFLQIPESPEMSLSSESIGIMNSLKRIAKQCKVSHRFQSIEFQVKKLRILYRNSLKPLPLSTKEIMALEDMDSRDASEIAGGLDPLALIAVGTALRPEPPPHLTQISESLQTLGTMRTFAPTFDSVDMLSSDDSDYELAERGSTDTEFANLLNEDEVMMLAENELALLENGADEIMLYPVLEEDEEDGTPLPPRSAEVIYATPETRTTESVPEICGASTSGRIAMARPEIKEYFPATTFQYYLSPSLTYEISTFYGANPYVCNCVKKGESPFHVNDFAMWSEDEDDLHDLLVKAWETKVFPLIRRRFRNESERRDGMEQIRTALRLGMLDIARQTVEGLYEEGGVLPRELIFPTLEQVKLEADRFTIDKIKVGMHVLIASAKSVISPKPKFAVNGMMDTFGLVGEVFAIDLLQELILVESYLESAGLLKRFWYPLKALERLPNEKKVLGTPKNGTVFKTHSDLVCMEYSLAQLYCRKSFLQILDLGLEPMTTKSFGEGRKNSKVTPSIQSLFQELSVDNLKIRSEDSFCDFPMNGDLLTHNLNDEFISIKHQKELGNPGRIFYKNPDKLGIELRQAIRQAYAQGGSEGVKDLTAKVCHVLETPSGKFVEDTIALSTDGMTEVQLPDTAFSLVSFQHELMKHGTHLTNILNEEPCVHVYAVNGLDLKKWPIICYPVQTLGALLKGTSPDYKSINPGQGIRNRRKTAFPYVITVGDRINCSVTHGLPDHFLHVNGIPAEFPLALQYCEQLLQFLEEISDDSLLPAGLSTLDLLIAFLQKILLPPLMKEWIFKLCSAFLNSRSLHPLVEEYRRSTAPFANRLFTELIVLYEQESQIHTNLTLHSKFPFEITIGRSVPKNNSNAHAQSENPASSKAEPSLPIVADKINKLHNFPMTSSYFQALLELCLNLTLETVSPIYMPATLSLEPTPMSVSQGMVSSAVACVSPPPPNSTKPPVPTTRKLTKATKQASGRPTIVGKRNSVVHHSKVLMDLEDLSAKGHPDMKWFWQSFYAFQLLKTFVRGESNAMSREAYQMCLDNVRNSSTHTRLFVIYGIPEDIGNRGSIETAVNRALNETGGIYELWMSDTQTEAVVEVRAAARTEQAFQILRKNLTWHSIEAFLVRPSVNVCKVNSSLETGNRTADSALLAYLREKIFEKTEPAKFSAKTAEAFSSIFVSCYFLSENEVISENPNDDIEDFLALKKEQLLLNVEDNAMRNFMEAVKPSNFELEDFAQEILKKFGHRKQQSSKDSCSVEKIVDSLSHAEDHKSHKLEKTGEFPIGPQAPSVPDMGLSLSESGFIDWCMQLANDNLKGLWCALLETGYDLRLDRTSIVDKTNFLHLLSQDYWTNAQGGALVALVNQLATKLRISPQLIHPHEVYIEKSLFLDLAFESLSTEPLDYVRVKFAILQHFNLAIFYNLFPFVSFTESHLKSSIGSMLHDARYLLFYATKDEFLYQICVHSAHRSHELSPLEIKLDPVASIGSTNENPYRTLFASIIFQLYHHPSQMLCVLPATGGDPPLPVVVRSLGEEVHGIIGSFRHFIGTVVQEFEGPPLKFFIPCPSAAAGKNKDSLILYPGPVTFGEECFLYCLGQFIGVCIRTDIPIPVTLLECTWRSLLAPCDASANPRNDLKESDVVTAGFLDELERCGDDIPRFNKLLESQEIETFEYMSIDGSRMLPLGVNGQNLALSHKNKDDFIRLVIELRSNEICCPRRVNAILTGLSAALPLPFILMTFTPDDFRLRVSGSPQVNLSLLKAHTHYQVGISETDLRIQFFWAALESLTPEQLGYFVKFATNQDRLPATCPCQTAANPSVAIHAPPFPLKLAPMDFPPGVPETVINQRTIRAETCLFLIRLPPYTSYQVMLEQILYACNSRNDPLSG